MAKKNNLYLIEDAAHQHGTVINGKTFATNSLTSLVFALTGDDLAIFDSNDTGWRVLAFQATYASSLGSGLPLKGECTFEISKLTNVVDG